MCEDIDGRSPPPGDGGPMRNEIESTVLPFAREHEIGVLIYGPLAHGLLTGRMTEDTAFATDDWRSTSDLFVDDAFRTNLAVVRDLTEFAARRDTTVARLAIAWTLANPAVDVAIVGARSPEQIRQTAPGADLRLTAEDLAQIELIRSATELARDVRPSWTPTQPPYVLLDSSRFSSQDICATSG